MLPGMIGLSLVAPKLSDTTTGLRRPGYTTDERVMTWINRTLCHINPTYRQIYIIRGQLYPTFTLALAALESYRC